MKSTTVLAFVKKTNLLPSGIKTCQAELHYQSCCGTETSCSVYKSFLRTGFATPSVHAHKYERREMHIYITHASSCSQDKPHVELQQFPFIQLVSNALMHVKRSYPSSYAHYFTLRDCRNSNICILKLTLVRNECDTDKFV